MNFLIMIKTLHTGEAEGLVATPHGFPGTLKRTKCFFNDCGSILSQRANFDVEFSTLLRLFSTPNKKPLKFRCRINVEISICRNFNIFSTTVEIFLRFSTLFRRPSKFRCRFNVESTSKMPAGLRSV